MPRSLLQNKITNDEVYFRESSVQILYVSDIRNTTSARIEFHQESKYHGDEAASMM